MKVVKLKTPVTYYGGKQTMLKHIRPLIPEHNLYTEAFAGGAALFFDKEPSNIEVINDLNGELVNFYKTVVSDFEGVKKEVDKTLHCRNHHAHAQYIYKNSGWFSDVQRAWALFVLSKTSFASQLDNSFGFDKAKPAMPKKLYFAKEAFNNDLKARLDKTTIEQDDALKVIKRYDTKESFHFVDPPYVGTNMGHYSGMFNNESLLNLLKLLVTIEGKFMLTMFPNETIQNFANANGWKVIEVERSISACKASSRRKQVEWIVLNYEPERSQDVVISIAA